MLRYILERGQSLYLRLQYNDRDKNPANFDSFTANITNNNTKSIVQSITSYDTYDVGDIGVLITTENLEAGRYYVNLKATLGDYQEEDVIMLDIQDHEGK